MFDVIILGSGPAGASLAKFLNDTNLKFLLLGKPSFGKSIETLGPNFKDWIPKIGISEEILNEKFSITTEAVSGWESKEFNSNNFFWFFSKLVEENKG